MHASCQFQCVKMLQRWSSEVSVSPMETFSCKPLQPVSLTLQPQKGRQQNLQLQNFKKKFCFVQAVMSSSSRSALFPMSAEFFFLQFRHFFFFSFFSLFFFYFIFFFFKQFFFSVLSLFFFSFVTFFQFCRFKYYL